ncbi:MAG TPA: tetratricopeptide repeat protein [Bacteroidales bacterium]|nr:tetratricopeptide repeat protein [Bacteroidales bacterium]
MKVKKIKPYLLLFLITQCFVLHSQNEAYNQLQEAAGNTSVYIPPVNGPVAVGEETSDYNNYNNNAQIIANYQSKAYDINNDGVYYHNSGNYNKAIRYYKRALWYDPYNETVRQNLKNAREAKNIYRGNKKTATRQYRQDQREIAQNQNTQDSKPNNQNENTHNNRRDLNTQNSLENTNSEANSEALKANQELEDSKAKLSDLKFSLDNTNKLLKMYSQSLINNTGELDSWAEMVDKTYQNTLNVSKEYFLNMFLKYSLLTNLDPEYRDGPYQKLEELLKSNDPNMSSWLTKELTSQNIKPKDVEKIVELVLLGYDAETIGSKIFYGSSTDILTKMDAVLFVNSVFEAADWVSYDKLKDASLFKQMAGVKGITKPGDWFAQAKVVGEVYSDLVVQCVSWKNINELVTDNEQKSHKVDALIIKQEQTIKQINCLEECIKNSGGDCMYKCTGKTKLHTPPPFPE